MRSPNFVTVARLGAGRSQVQVVVTPIHTTEPQMLAVRASSAMLVMGNARSRWLSNPEIGARLFLGPRAVEWHQRERA
jgi:hypothetical protein